MIEFASSRRALAAALLSISAVGPVLAQTKGEPVEIGAVLAVTGPFAVVGLPERDGILLAQKLVNAGNGVNGRPINITIEDDTSSPDVAVTKANALVFSKKIKALLGGTGISSTVAMGGITAPISLPQVAFTGLGPAIEKERRCVFHLTPAQELNARSVLEYATRVLKARKVAALYDSGYGQSVFSSLKSLTGEYGVDVVAAEKFDVNATDMTTQAAKLRAANPEVVLIISQNATAFRNVRQVKIAAPIVATHPSTVYDAVRAMGDASADVVFADFLIAEEPLPHQKAFVEAFQKEYGRLPKNFEAAGYDSVMAVVAALAAAGPGASNEKVCAALTTSFQGQLAQYDFAAPDRGGLRQSSFVYSKYVNGKFTRLPFKAGAQ